MRLLVFSDMHNDMAALAKLMEIEADYYIAAGDTVSWASGLDRAGEILARRAGRVWVLPGSHESEADIARMCGAHGLNRHLREEWNHLPPMEKIGETVVTSIRWPIVIHGSLVSATSPGLQHSLGKAAWKCRMARDMMPTKEGMPRVFSATESPLASSSTQA